MYQEYLNILGETEQSRALEFGFASLARISVSIAGDEVSAWSRNSFYVASGTLKDDKADDRVRR